MQASNTSFVATGSGAVSDRLSFGAVSYRYVPLPLLNDVPQAALSLCCVPIFNGFATAWMQGFLPAAAATRYVTPPMTPADGVAYCAT